MRREYRKQCARQELLKTLKSQDRVGWTFIFFFIPNSFMWRALLYNAADLNHVWIQQYSFPYQTKKYCQGCRNIFYTKKIKAKRKKKDLYLGSFSKCWSRTTFCIFTRAEKNIWLKHYWRHLNLQTLIKYHISIRGLIWCNVKIITRSRKPKKPKADRVQAIQFQKRRCPS